MREEYHILIWFDQQVSLAEGKSFSLRHIRPVQNTQQWRQMGGMTSNPLTSNDHYNGCTAPLTSKRYILYIHSTNIGTEYFKHGTYSPFFVFKMQFISNSNVFGSCIIHILFTRCAKIKKNFGAKMLIPKKHASTAPI